METAREATELVETALEATDRSPCGPAGEVHLVAHGSTVDTLSRGAVFGHEALLTDHVGGQQAVRTTAAVAATDAAVLVAHTSQVSIHSGENFATMWVGTTRGDRKRGDTAQAFAAFRVALGTGDNPGEGSRRAA